MAEDKNKKRPQLSARAPKRLSIPDAEFCLRWMRYVAAYLGRRGCKRVTLREMAAYTSLPYSTLKVLWPELVGKESLVKARLSPVQKARIQAKATQAGMTVSELLLTCVDRAELVVADQRVDREHNTNTARIARNLWDVARWCRFNVQTITPEAAQAIQQELIAIERQVAALNRHYLGIADNDLLMERGDV